jgi:uncharacterized repeat protein (TIGR02543 family)
VFRRITTDGVTNWYEVGEVAEVRIPIPAGHSFARWEDVVGISESGLSASVQGGMWVVTFLMPDNDITFSAVFELNSHAVATVNATFRVGTSGPWVISGNIEFGSVVRLTVNPFTASQQFMGWSANVAVNTDVNGAYFIMPDHAVTVTAIIEDIPVARHLVTFNFDDGRQESVFVDDGDTVERPSPDPVRVGHTFVRWYRLGAGTGEYNFGTPVTSDITIVAMWQQNSYTLQVTGGSFAADFMDDFGGVYYGSPVGLTPIVPLGMRFSHWTTSPVAAMVVGANGNATLTMPAFNLAATAHFVPDSGVEPAVLTLRQGSNKFQFIYFDRTPVNRNAYVYNPLVPVYLINVAGGEVIADVLGQFTNSAGNIRVLDGNGNIIPTAQYTGRIGTGMTIELLNAESQVIDSFTIVIRGDVNGDGLVSPLDIAAIQNHYRGVAALEGAFLLAADVNLDGLVTTRDVLAINLHRNAMQESDDDLFKGLRLAWIAQNGV